MIIFLLAFTAAAGFARTGAPVAYIEEDAGDPYAPSVKADQAISITLDENLTTPYFWVFVISDETVMIPEDDEYIPDPNLLMADGVGGKHRFDFRAVGAGECMITFYLVDNADDTDNAVNTASYCFIVEE